MSAAPFLTLTSDTPETTTALAEAIAQRLRAGDVLLLTGPIGAGKTHFARALIQSRMAASGQIEDVPSPTFTLVQTYELDPDELWHADLYRLTDPTEVIELGLEEAFETAICLVEWPDRLGELAPDTALSLTFRPDPKTDSRVLEFAAKGPDWPDRLSDLGGTA
ncbi:tRNA (adenosine(37)-N6)-threonylcarbamoyltransferase complex ATPase subunit type 1 TsaE [Actibacterium pelagium]|uniref:tRNA threonylcarbamoyladenosine biosynthesis protein TsaE n=1 Tax=Actibacterium pelagium TaxID=2029103 RepID=A0A917EM54_9RHOB|nr:tRNA (adenosine(37)-N6)-threonylcarbamoyltransferase complex ATPase subunit type 1 TsaE [Actibacterium pelagium]GGE55661.1 hypothetical protein GCM10011517_24100 [Actibacterium pelagium]